MTLGERLRAALGETPRQPLLPGDMVEASMDGGAPAAVLIAVTDRVEPGVILTVRRPDMRTHAGQIAFPGGRIDPGEGPAEAAVREAWEELGLEPGRVELVSELDSYVTVTGYRVTPVIGIVPPDLPLVPHEHEVADWFEAPLGHLLDPAHHQRHAALFEGLERHYYRIDWNGRHIWGATAAMIVNLSRRLGWS
jgi:8-oxo-dGTP pyrophosphatase MutT (NUDIX family)